MLTDTEIRKAKPRSATYRMTDGRGLYLAVTPSGGKLWRWKYRHIGSEKLMSFGRYPDVPLANARERHAGARKLLAEGVDPMEKRKADKTATKTLFRLLQNCGWSIGKPIRALNTLAPRNAG